MSANGRIGLDPATGGLVALRLTKPESDLVHNATGRGLLRLAFPLPDYPSHYLEAGTHGRPEIDRRGDRVRLVYPELVSDDRTVPVRVKIDLTPADKGLVLRAQVHNGSNESIPQVIFPQLLGLDAVGGVDQARLQLGGGRMLPFEELQMRPDDAWWLNRGLQTYVPYGSDVFNMKWFDYGDPERGVTLYSRSPRCTTQSLVVTREDRAIDRVHVLWAHYPFIRPSETWDSDDYVLLPHAGDWYAGARAYQQFASVRYPYCAPQRLREALGIRTVWLAPRAAPPTFRFSQLPEYAGEIADPDLGLAELNVWYWWLKNGYPLFLDPRLGTEEDLREALDRCREMGVPVALFASHHLVRDTDETDPKWLHRNAAGQTVSGNWTHGLDYLPLFNPPFMVPTQCSKARHSHPLARNRVTRIRTPTRTGRHVNHLRSVFRMARTELQPGHRRPPPMKKLKSSSSSANRHGR